ncbi:MAG: transketolase [Candidatus Roizmanbacteria bacterium]
MDTLDLLDLCKKTRSDVIRSTTTAGSGHPTSCMSATELMITLWFDDHFFYDDKNPSNISNDRIIMSKGHVAPLLYSLYETAGFITSNDMMSLRKITSKYEGHPTARIPYVDVATGSLGQGLSAGVGLAIGINLRVNNKELIIERTPRVYVLLGDSEMAEGQVWEALQLASHYKLNNLIGIIDINRFGQRGTTMLEWDLQTYKKRVESFGWNVILIEDGNNLEDVQEAYELLEKIINGKLHKNFNQYSPTMIIAKTNKGHGVSFLQNADGWHGKPVPKDMLDSALKEIGEVGDLHAQLPLPSPTGVEIANKISENPQHQLLTANYSLQTLVATREAFGDALVSLGSSHKNILSLDAETSNSTFADKYKKAYPDRFLEMYIAEQNMVSVGVALSKIGYIPFISSFAAFLSRAFDQVRMAQYSLANIKIVGTHAGISIGEDGPSQMALEDLAIFRSLVNSVVLYPSDATSTVALFHELVKYNGISYIRLTREKTPVLYSDKDSFIIGGSHVIHSSDKDVATIIGAGITLHEAIKAYEELKNEGIFVNVIDAYSIKPLDVATIKNYAKKTKKVIVVEDHYPDGGLGDAVQKALTGEQIQFTHLAVNDLPRSGKPSELLRTFNIDSQAIIEAVKNI